MADQDPARAAIKIPQGRKSDGTIRYLTLSFAELEAEAAAWQSRLLGAGVQRGDRTLVMVRPGLPLIAAAFALFACGAVPVIIDPGMGLGSFLSCVRQTKPRALLGIPLARLVSRVAFSAFASVKVRVGAGTALDGRLSEAFDAAEPGRKWPRLTIAPTSSRDLAAILFTSGSTGAPKGVCYEQGMFEAQVRLVKETYGIQPGEVDLPLLPIFALFNPALGMTSIVPEIDPKHPASVDPAKIVQAIQQERVTNSFGSPTLWRVIGSHCVERGIQLPSMKRILCAGAPVPARLWEDSKRFLPNGQMHSPYGATEILPVSSISAQEADYRSLLGAPVGRPVREVDVRIVEITDAPIASIEETRPLPPGHIGEIIAKGPVVTRSYDALPEATAAAKIAEGEACWHRLGDTGFLDETGALWFCGRKVERVETEDGTLFTEPCERVFREHPKAQRCALIGLGPKGRQIPALAVEARPANSREARELARELRHLALAQPATRAIKRFYFFAKFPVDVRHNAKIHRLTLAKWARKSVGFESDPKR